MKKNISILTVLFLLSTTAFSQVTYDRGFALGVKAGLNISTVSTGLGERANPKTGLQAGFYGRVRFSPQFSFRSELNYSSQGVGNPSTGTVSMHYVNVPLLLEYGKKFNIHLGPQAGFLLAAEGGYFSIERYKRYELALVTGIGYYSDGPYNFGARYTVGFTNLYKDASVTSLSRVLHFYVAYKF